MFKVLGLDRITEAGSKWSNINSPLKRWRASTEACTAKSYPELKKTFNSVDYKKPSTIFDIGGNKWRLISLIDYQNRTVIIKFILDHKEYTDGKWS